MDDDQEMTQYYDGGTQFDEPDEPQENDSTLGGGGDAALWRDSTKSPDGR